MSVRGRMHPLWISTNNVMLSLRHLRGDTPPPPPQLLFHSAFSLISPSSPSPILNASRDTPSAAPAAAPLYGAAGGEGGGAGGTGVERGEVGGGGVFKVALISVYSGVSIEIT